MKRNNWLIIGGLVLCASAFVIFSGKGTEKQEVNAITVERTGRVANMAKPVVVNETLGSTGKQVSSQLELRNALNDSSLSTIVIDNDNGEEFNIPSGDYSKVSLVVNAPNSDITNQGLFKDITINAIASDTWIEKVNGNILILNAAAGHIVVPNDVEVTEIRIVNETVDSQFVLDIAGDVSKITIDSTSEVKLNVSGKVGDIEINDRASVVIEGTAKDDINIVIGENADGTSIVSNVTLNVESASDADIMLKKGAEGSNVSITDDNKIVEVTNNTTEKVTVKSVDNNEVIVDPNKNGTVNSQGSVVNSTTGGVTGVDGITPPVTPVVPVTPSEPSSGQSGSDSGNSSDSGNNSGSDEAQSSGNITRIITRFETLPSICAGTYGEALLPISALNLPTSVVGVATNGDRITFPIVKWNNKNNYSISSLAGSYEFIGEIGTPTANVKFSINSGVMPSIRVYVKAISELEYADEIARGLSINVYTSPDDKIEYYEFKNPTQKTIEFNASCSYYDENGYMMTNKTESIRYWSTLYKGDTQIIGFRKETDFSYASRKVTISAYNTTYEKSENALNDIAFTYEKEPTELKVKVKNNSNKLVGSVDLACLFFDENGKATGLKYASTDKVYAPGYEDTIEIPYPTNAAPASYLVYLSGGYVNGDANTDLNRDGIEYADEIARGLSINVYTSPDDKIEYYEFKNPTQKTIEFNASCSYYDENGYMMTNKTESIRYWSTLYKGDTQIIGFRKETDFSYASRKVTISAYNTTYEKSENALNDIAFTYEKEPTELKVKVKNNSNKLVGSVDLACLFFDENGKATGLKYASTDKVYAPGYEDTIEIPYPTSSIPASYLVYVSGAYVTGDIAPNDLGEPATPTPATGALPASGEWTYQGVLFSAEEVAHFHALWDYTGDAAGMATHHSAAELLSICKADGIAGDNYPDDNSNDGGNDGSSWVGPWTYQGVTFSAAQVAHFHALWDYTGDAQEMATHHSAEELLTVCRMDGIPGDNYPEGESGGNGENNNSDAWVGPWTYQGVTFSAAQVAHFHALWDYTGDAQEMATHHSAEELLTVCRIDGI